MGSRRCCLVLVRNVACGSFVDSQAVDANECGIVFSVSSEPRMAGSCVGRASEESMV